MELIFLEHRYSQASKRVADVYRSGLNKLDMSVRNAVYDELTKESARAFGDGWTEAMAWMRSHPDCTISECLEAKASELKDRYPYMGVEKSNPNSH